MPRLRTFIIISVLAVGSISLASVSVMASPAQGITATVTSQSTPTFDVSRLAQPPTVYPPEQADNGAQTYWGMCMPCHGDHGQGLTEEWRASYSPEEHNCWQSGCHGSDAPENSFEIPQAGAPALVGVGKLARFSNAFEMSQYIQQNMPFFRTGALTSEESWWLTAYLLRLNNKQVNGLVLGDTTGSAIPIHRKVNLPESGIPGTLFLMSVLILASIGLKRLPVLGRTGTGLRPARPNFFHHLHPPSIPAEQSRFRYTLGAGGASIFLSLVLFVTGLLEMYYYVPTPGQAAISVETITTLVPYGSLVRRLHFWSAQFLVLVVTIHMLRVALTGAYSPPRRFNYLLGLGLFVLVLLLDFTGYILRWDEGIHWALVVGANLLKTIPSIGEAVYRFVIGGSEAGPATLIRFYAWHIFGLSLGAIILIVWHAFRVRRDGGIAVSPSSERRDKDRITRFTLLNREVLTMTILAATLLLFSLLVPAPIARPISDVGTMTGNSQAPWFFLWIQQLLNLGNPFLLGVLTPVLVIIVLGLLPYVLPNAKPEELGRWFPRGNRLAQILIVSIMVVILVLTLWGSFFKG